MKKGAYAPRPNRRYDMPWETKVVLSICSVLVIGVLMCVILPRL